MKKLTPEEMEKKILELEQNNAGILSLLRKVMDPEGKLNINMTVQELIIQITGKSNDTLEISTTNIEGKIMLCALKDFGRNNILKFSAMSAALDNRGWHTPDGSLAPTLSRMISKGLIIKENGGYRLPSKVTYIGEALNAE